MGRLQIITYLGRRTPNISGPVHFKPSKSPTFKVRRGVNVSCSSPHTFTKLTMSAEQKSHRHRWWWFLHVCCQLLLLRKIETEATSCCERGLTSLNIQLLRFPASCHFTVSTVSRKRNEVPIPCPTLWRLWLYRPTRWFTLLTFLQCQENQKTAYFWVTTTTTFKAKQYQAPPS